MTDRAMNRLSRLRFALAAGAALITAAAAVASAAAQTALPAPEGAFNTVVAVNNARVILGNSYVFGAGSTALVWTDGRYRTLTVDGYASSLAYALTEAGTVVGAAYQDNEQGPRPVVWTSGRANLLPTLGGRGVAYDVNESGVIAGSVDTPNAGTEPALWQDGKLTLLPSFGIGNSEAFAIADDGTVYGIATMSNEGDSVPVMWKNGVLTPLPASFGPDYLGVVRVHGASTGFVSGTVVRREAVPDVGDVPFVIATAWENGVFRELERPAGKGNSRVYGVNRLGHYAGSFEDEQGATVPAVWTREGPNALPALGEATTIAAAVNDNGFVVGAAIRPPEPGQTFTAVPVVWDLSQQVTIGMADVTAAAGQTVSLKATASRNGRPAANQQVTFSVNGRPAGTALTNGRGEAVLGYSVPRAARGELRASASAPGANATALRSVIVGKSPAVTAMTPALGRAGQRVTLTANLRLGPQNKPLAKKPVTIFVNGRSAASATTDAAGVARASIVMPPGTPGSPPAQVEVRYAGDGASSASTARVAGYQLR